MIQVTNAKEFNRGLDDWLAATEKEITETFRGLAYATVEYLIEETPQWTGNAASNWRVSVNGSGVPMPDETLLMAYHNDPSNFAKETGCAIPKYSVGDSPAVAMAKSDALSKLRNVGLSDSIRVVNPAKSLSGNAYAAMVEANPNSYLRPENDAGSGAGHMVYRTVSYMEASYPRLDESDIQHLRGGLR